MSIQRGEVIDRSDAASRVVSVEYRNRVGWKWEASNL